MIDGPDFNDSDGAEIAIIPKACPYCAQSNNFSIRTGVVDLENAILIFGEEEREESQ